MHCKVTFLGSSVPKPEAKDYAGNEHCETSSIIMLAIRLKVIMFIMAWSFGIFLTRVSINDGDRCSVGSFYLCQMKNLQVISFNLIFLTIFQQVQNKVSFPREPKVSAECRKLITKVLSPLKLRVKIPQILADPWLNPNQPAKDEEVDTAQVIINRIRRQ